MWVDQMVCNFGSTKLLSAAAQFSFNGEKKRQARGRSMEQPCYNVDDGFMGNILYRVLWNSLQCMFHREEMMLCRDNSITQNLLLHVVSELSIIYISCSIPYMTAKSHCVFSSAHYCLSANVKFSIHKQG